MIDQQTIGKIIDAADVVEVVGDFVKLKKRGVNYIGLCPFHNEKTPSFTVSPSKGICKCFGCGAGGNAVNFIMQHENMSYPEALRYLARKYNIPIEEKELTEEEKQEKSKLESLRIITDFAVKYFHNTLKNDKEGKAIGLSYFKERGFLDSTIDYYQLGYCPSSGDAFTQEAIKKGYKLDLMIDLGLSKKGQYSTFDFFKGRVIFPIQNLSGHTIAFGGRILENNKKIAKYFNSPETPLYHKSNVLYGIFQAKRSISEKGKCFLVEGYTDVLSMYQSGIKNVVASSGTALTIGQIRLIKRFTPNITILYDGDAAGIKAALKGIDLVLEQGMNVRVVLLPDGEDPDSFARNNTEEELLTYIEHQEKDFISFKSELLMLEAKGDPVKKAEVIRSVVASISKISDVFIRTEFIKNTANVLDISEEILTNEVKKIIYRKIDKEAQQLNYKDSVSTPTQIDGNVLLKDDLEYFKSTERAIIRHLLLYGNKILKIDEGLENFRSTTVAEYIFDELFVDNIKFVDETLYDILYLAFDYFRENKKIDIQFFIQHQDTTIQKIVTDLISVQYELSEMYKKNKIHIEEESQKVAKSVPDYILIYKARSVYKKIDELNIELKKVQEENNDEKLIELMQQINILNIAKKELAHLLKRVQL